MSVVQPKLGVKVFEKRSDVQKSLNQLTSHLERMGSSFLGPVELAAAGGGEPSVALLSPIEVIGCHTTARQQGPPSIPTECRVPADDQTRFSNLPPHLHNFQVSY